MTDKEKEAYIRQNTLPEIHKDCNKILRDLGLPLPKAKQKAKTDKEFIQIVQQAGILDLLVGYKSDED